VASLNHMQLSKVFTSVSSTITTSRAETPVVDVTEALANPFDRQHQGEFCELTCRMTKMEPDRQGPRRWWRPCSNSEPAQAKIKQRPFACGGMRVVHAMEDSKYPGEAMVAKKLLDTEHASEALMLPFMRSTMVAMSHLKYFQRALNDCKVPLNICFVYCYLYEYDHDESSACFIGEQRLDGKLVKFNGNNGYVNVSAPHSDAMQAFSHFTFIESRGKNMVVDLQGTIDQSWVLLTDPQVLSRDQKDNESPSLYGHGDLGFNGIKQFFGTHNCGRICHALHLPERQKSLKKEFELEHRRCIICFDAPRGVVLNPCGHSLLCRPCVLKMMQDERPCPSCRGEILGFEEGLTSKTYVSAEERKRIRKRGRKKRR